MQAADDYCGLFEDAPIAYHELDTEGFIVRVNRAECELLGYEPHEMVGRPIWQFIAGIEYEDSRRNMADKLAGIRPIKPFVRQYVTKKQRLVSVEIHDRVLRTPDGRATGIRSTLIDVTARIAAETARREAEEWLNTVLRSIGEAVVAVDALGQLKLLNASAEALCGWSEPSAAGMGLEEVVRLSAIEVGSESHDSLESLFLFSLKEAWTGSGTLDRAAGGAQIVEIRSAPIESATGTVLGVVLVLKPK